MGKLNLSGIVKKTQTRLIKHAPGILTGVGIAGMITSTVLAVKVTPKALDILSEIKEQHAEDTDKKAMCKDVIMRVGPIYIPTVLTLTASTICIISANNVHAKRNAALAAAYTISDTALREYREKVVETIGEKKEKAIKDEIVKDKIANDPVNENEVIITKKGETLCRDMMFGRYFKSDIESIRQAMNKINRTIIRDMYASLNDFYDEIGLPPVEVGYLLGWNIDTKDVEIEFTPCLTEDNTPCLGIHYSVPPRYSYENLI